MIRTILITSCHPIISRNILSTGIIEYFLRDGFRVGLVVPASKEDYFKKTFKNEGVFIVKIEEPALKGINKILKYLSLSAIDTSTIRIKQITEMNGRGKYSRYLFAKKFAIFIIRFIEKIRFIKDINLESPPDIVFCTDIQNDIDINLLIWAQRKKIKNIAMVRSWDNLTSKGLIRVVPQKLIVWNDIMKSEAINLHRINQSIIEIVGIPHYDKYRNYNYSDKASFFKKIGLDMSKKIVLFIPIGDRYLKNNTVDRDVVDLLDKLLPCNYQILVRMPVGDYISELNNNPVISNDRIIIYDKIKSKFDNIKMTEMDHDDDEHFAKLMFHSDLVVTGPSTCVIDAIYFDKPVVMFGFDGYQARSYYESIRRYYDYNNFQPIIHSRGVKLSLSVDEFIKDINEYIHNPSKDQFLRKKLLNLEVKITNGTSTKLLYSIISKFLEK